MMEAEKVFTIFYCMFGSLSAVGMLLTILDVDITNGQSIEFIISLIFYHLLSQIVGAKSRTEEVRLPTKDFLLPFIAYSIISGSLSALIMYFFDVHLSSNIQVALEIFSMYCYQYFYARAHKSSI